MKITGGYATVVLSLSAVAVSGRKIYLPHRYKAHGCMSEGQISFTLPRIEPGRGDLTASAADLREELSGSVEK
jgi:hypothetical protein